MKVNEVNGLIKKHLQPVLSGYKTYRDLLYKVEHGFFIKGYNFESSGNGEFDLAVVGFIQPLYVKTEYLAFTFGERLTYRKKNGLFGSKELEWWDATKEKLDESFQSILESILKKGEKEMNLFKEPMDFYKKYKPEVKDNIRVYEAVAYTTILLNDEALQNKMLKGLIEFSLAKVNRDTSWIDKIREDATLLFEAGTQEKRLEILKDWSNETLRHLKLPEVPLFN